MLLDLFVSFWVCFMSEREERANEGVEIRVVRMGGGVAQVKPVYN